jgi:sugar transferase (PEP-CTERM/EpsH1 system associated)
MKVLFVSHRVPFPPQSGSKVRAFHIIRHLAERGHSVTVASLARSREELAGAEGLAQYCTERWIETVGDSRAWMRMLGRVPTSRPSSFGFFHSTRLARRVHDALDTQAYELVFVHSSSMAPYVLGAPSCSLRVLDFCDMDSQKWREYSRHKPFPQSAGYRLEALKLERAEARLAPAFDLCTCATPAELQTLQHLAPQARADWFPNGVDSTLFQPADHYDAGLIAFVGRMDYYPNQQAVRDFCRNVLPRLQKSRPALRFEVVGADPPQSVRGLARLPGVTVTGSVPDVRPYLARAALTVAPLTIARGTQNKVLESMAMGVPVVCSPSVSQGVDAVAGEHLLCASSADEFVEAVEHVLGSALVRDRLARAARERVLTHHSWSGSLARLDTLIAAAFARRAGQGTNAAAPRAMALNRSAAVSR